jgi:hypothetical protein
MTVSLLPLALLSDKLKVGSWSSIALQRRNLAVRAAAHAATPKGLSCWAVIRLQQADSTVYGTCSRECREQGEYRCQYMQGGW